MMHWHKEMLYECTDVLYSKYLLGVTQNRSASQRGENALPRRSPTGADVRRMNTESRTERSGNVPFPQLPNSLTPLLDNDQGVNVY
jgi:hypothetical protein